MIDLTIRTQMDKHGVYRSELQLLYRTMIHAAIAVGVLIGVFAVDFCVDWAVNGTDNAWSVTKSLFWLSIVMTCVVAVYCAVSPLIALLGARGRIKRDASLTRERLLKFDKKGLTFPEGEGGKDTIEWEAMRIRRTKDFVVFRTAAGAKGPQVVLPRAAATAEELAAIEAYKKEVDHKTFLRQNPVEAERERKAAERLAAEQAAQTAEQAPAEQAPAGQTPAADGAPAPDAPCIPEEDPIDGTDG